jgi:hypothetical protein
VLLVGPHAADVELLRALLEHSREPKSPRPRHGTRLQR